MSTKRFCDRCGALAAQPIVFGAQFDVDQWRGDGSMEPRQENVVVQIDVTQPRCDFDRPDLCLDCQIVIVQQTLMLLRQQRTADTVVPGQEAEVR